MIRYIKRRDPEKFPISWQISLRPPPSLKIPLSKLPSPLITIPEKKRPSSQCNHLVIKGENWLSKVKSFLPLFSRFHEQIKSYGLKVYYADACGVQNAQKTCEILTKWGTTDPKGAGGKRAPLWGVAEGGSLLSSIW